MSGEVEKGAKLERIERALDNPQAALKQIGALMVAESQAAFRDQKFDGKPWPGRRVPNVMGIIADLYAGKKTPPARRFEARPALRDTGALSRSIAARIVSSDTVEVGTVDQKAATHQFGGQSESKPINQQVRDALASWLRGPGKPWRKTIGWLLNKKFAGKTIKTNVPARPFVGITKQTIDDAYDVVAVRIMEAE